MTHPSEFKCLKCGNCCRWPGFVRPTNAEISQAAALLELSEQAFINEYTTLAPDRSGLIYKEAPDGACVFLTPENTCAIYPARPIHCRTFPQEWDVPPELQKRCAGKRELRRQAQQPIAFAHVLGHPAKPLDVTAAPEDAQVLNCLNICLLLEKLNIPYAYYGCPGSILPEGNGVFVNCGKPTSKWSYGNAWHRLYNKRLSRRLHQNAMLNGAPEIILSLYGAAQADIELPGNLPVIEPMVGYDHCWAPYRVFPSYAQQNVLYVTQQRQTAATRFFDTVIPHFLPAENYWLSHSPKDYLLFLGRNAPDKGVDIARQIAKAAGMPIKIVHNGLYGREKTELIANAAAVLMPTLYMEPFGYVAAEAQLCGTPVITTDWGAFSETVIHGVTGFRCRTQTEFLDAVANAPDLNRQSIRDSAVERFSLEKIAPKYDNYFRFVWNVHNNGGYYAYAATRYMTDE